METSVGFPSMGVSFLETNERFWKCKKLISADMDRSAS